MAQEKKNKISGRIISALIVLAGIYVAFLLYQSVYYNYKTSEKISSLKKEISQIEQDQEKIQSLISYYKTDSFQELEARKKLGMRLPGEKVVKVDVLNSNTPVQAQPVQKEETKKSNPSVWIEFIQGKIY